MRIVQVVIGGEVAGGQIVALQIARAARDAGHTVSFVSPSSGPFLERAQAEGFATQVVPVRSALDVRALVLLARAFRGADVIHTHAHFSINVVARAAGRLTGAHVLSHMHIENAFRENRGRRAQIALDNVTARLCFAIVAVSDATKRALATQGYPRDRMITVHNGIDAAAPADPVRLAEGPVVLQVARLAEVKGQRRLVGALSRLDATAVLVGRDLEQGGAYERELRREAERLGVSDRVVFAGYRDDVPALLAGCEVFCLPSRVEGMPLVVLEAMAQAKPVVATAVGGTPEIVVDGETGLLVPPDDVDALAAALARLLADPELARRIGAAGRARVERDFSLAGMTKRVLQLYGA